MNTVQNRHALVPEARPRRRRPDHPEDYGRGPWWRLAELMLLGFVFPSPPPLTQWFEDDEDEMEA